MEKTVSTVIRTGHGVVVVRSRNPKENQWRFVKIKLWISDWRERNSDYIRKTTGLQISKGRFEVIAEDEKSILCAVTVSDLDVMRDIISRAEDGTQVNEVSYYLATHGRSIQLSQRELLLKHRLNVEPGPAH